MDFYPLEHNKVKGILTGTLRIKLSEIGVHLLGIYVSKKNNSWFFQLPGKFGSHHQTGEAIRFPFFCFENRDQQRELIAEIQKKAPAFIEKRLADLESPLIFPKKSPSQLKQVESPETPYNSTGAKETVYTPSLKSTAMKDWSDPPPLRKRRPGISQKR